MFQRLKRVFGFASEADEEDRECMTDDEERQSDSEIFSSDSPSSDNPCSDGDPSDTSAPDSPEDKDPEVETDAAASLPPVPSSTTTEENLAYAPETPGEGKSSEDSLAAESSKTPEDTDGSESFGEYDLLNELKRLSRRSGPRYVKECLTSIVAQLRLYQSLETQLRTILEELPPIEGERPQEDRRVEPDTDTSAQPLLPEKHSPDEKSLDLPATITESIPPLSPSHPCEATMGEDGLLSQSPSDIIPTLVESQETLAQDQTQVTEAKQSVSELQTAFIEAKETIQERDKSISELQQALTEARETIQERDRSISELQQALTEARAQVETLHGELEPLRRRNVQLDEIRKKRDVMVAEANAKAHRTKVDSEKALSEKEAELATLKLRVAELEATEQQLTTTKEEKDLLVEEMGHLVEEKELLTESLAQSSKEVESYKAEIEKLKSKLSEIEVRYNAAIEELIQQNGPEVTLPTKRKRGRPRKSDNSQQPNTDQSSTQSLHSPDSLPNEANTAAEPHTKGYVDPDTVLTPDKDAPVREEATAASKRKVRPDVSTIDELLNGADWMEPPTPPKKTPKKPKRQEEEDDFGYKAPPPRHPDSDAQMSLW